MTEGPPYPPPPPGKSGNTGLLVGLIALGVVVILLLAGVLVVARLTLRRPRPPGATATATASASPAPSTNVEITEEDVQGLLDSHAEALHSRDESAFLAAYDQHNVALLTGQQLLFENLVKIPFEETKFATGEPVAPVSQPPEQPAIVSTDVAFVHRIAGVDVRSVAEYYRWTISRASRDAPLVVTAVGGGISTNAVNRGVAWPAPWDLLQMSVIRLPHVIVLAGPGASGKARKWAGKAETSAEQDLAAWGTRQGGSRGFLVLFENDRRRFSHYYGAREVREAAGYALSVTEFAALGTTSSVSVGADRIVIYTGSNFFKSGEDPAYLFSHEMAHALVAPVGPQGEADLPDWVVEGFATYLEVRHRSTAIYLRDRYFVNLRHHGLTGHLPRDTALRSANTQVAFANYGLSLLAYLFIAERFGDAKVFQFVIAAYNDPTPEGTVRALREVTGLDLVHFEAQWSAYVRRKAG